MKNIVKSFVPNKYFKYYFYWICERQNIFWKRFNGEDPPYTDDPILQRHKFTNVYRVLDRVSQYLLSDVIYNGKTYDDKSMFWRIWLYKHFNSINTWDYLIHRFGDITTDTPIDDIIECLSLHKSRGYTIYSNAYMLTASFMRNGKIMQQMGIEHVTDKHEAYLRIFKRYLLDNNYWLSILTPTFEAAYARVIRIPTVGPFLGYQYIQDLNYSTMVNWYENDFCSPGNGTIRGIRRTFDLYEDIDYGEIVKWVYENFDELMNEHTPDRIVEYDPLKNHPPQVADLSNCFCEVDKYLRGLGVMQDVHGKRIKSRFNQNPKPIEYMFPPKWKIDALI